MKVTETLKTPSKEVKSSEKARKLREAYARSLMKQDWRETQLVEWVLELVKAGKQPEEIIAEATAWGFSKAEAMQAMLKLLEEGEVFDGPEGFKVVW